MAPKLAGWSSVVMFVLGLFVLAFDGVGGGVVGGGAVDGGSGGVGLGERAVVGSVADVVGSVAVAGGCLTSSSSVGMASVAAAPSTVHASATFDGYGVSTGTAATSIQSAGFAFVSVPFATSTSAKSDGIDVSAGTGRINLAATNTADPLVPRAALDPILSSLESYFSTDTADAPTSAVTTTPSPTTTSPAPAAATTDVNYQYAGMGPAPLSPHALKMMGIALGVGLPLWVILLIWLTWLVRHRENPRPRHRSWPDDAYTGRGGIELRNWTRVAGETPGEEMGRWRKWLLWWKR